MPPIDAYELVLLIIGLGAVVAAASPALIHGRPLSLPIVLVAFGALAYPTIGSQVALNPPQELMLTERLTEIGVLVSLMGAGLAIDRPVGWKRWSSTWRLLAITMPLGIGLITVLGLTVLHLPLASALLLGAVLAPTDPVIAEEIQVGAPTTNDASNESNPADEVRFALTSEAGLNDALAFPFVYAAITVAAEGVSGSSVATWLGFDFVYRIVVGFIVGIAAGWLMQRLAFRPPRRMVRLADLAEGFVAIALMLLAYGGAEIVSGYGFLAVFTAAVTLRSFERSDEYHRDLHAFVEQFERLVVVLLLVLFGGSLGGGLLDGSNARTVIVGVVAVLFLRPLAGLAGLTGGSLSRKQRTAIAFFGIKGIGSLYYLSYALGKEPFEHADLLWSTVTAAILCSLIVHGVSATPALRTIE